MEESIFSVEAGARLVQPDILVALVEEKKNRAYGALVFSGPGTELVSTDYATAVARMAKGVLRALIARPAGQRARRAG